VSAEAIGHISFEHETHPFCKKVAGLLPDKMSKQSSESGYQYYFFFKLALPKFTSAIPVAHSEGFPLFPLQINISPADSANNQAAICCHRVVVAVYP
jgi:hypothetical protein